MPEKTVYLTLEPYVYLSIGKGSVFLYNTLNKKVLESDSPPVVKLVTRLLRADQLQVIELDWRQVQGDNDIKRFIEKAKRLFMVDCIPARETGNKPVQFVPMIGLRKDIEKRRGVYSFAKHGIRYLKDLTVYINSRCERNCSMCGGAYRQFPCCFGTATPGPELNLEVIKNILSEAPSLAQLNILGGNIFKYLKFPELIALLKETKATKTFYIHYLNLVDAEVDFGMFKHPACFINVVVPFPLEKDKLQEAIAQPVKKNLNFNVNFILQSEKELLLARETAGRMRIDRFSFSPFFNGRNKTFFKKYVYIKRKALLNAKTSIKEIFSRQVINRNYFGKLVILAGGRVYANLNERPLGHIKTGSIRGLVYEELRKERSWLRTRDKVSPCRECHYRFLCPSISNYEYAVGKHTLCTLREEG